MIFTFFLPCKVQIVRSLMMVFFTPKYVGAFYVNFNANLKLLFETIQLCINLIIKKNGLEMQSEIVLIIFQKKNCDNRGRVSNL